MSDRFPQCYSSGANWQNGDFLENREACGGLALERSCLLSGGECGNPMVKMLLIILPLALLLSGCLYFEKSEDPTILGNTIPEGGPVLVYAETDPDEFAQSVDLVKQHLNNEEHVRVFDESLKWFAMETDVPFKNLNGMTARRLVEYVNALKKGKVIHDGEMLYRNIPDVFPLPEMRPAQKSE